MAAPDLHPRRIVHVTEAPLGGVVTYLDELLSLQIKMMPDTAIDLITPSVNRPALEHLQADDAAMTACMAAAKRGLRLRFPGNPG